MPELPEVETVRRSLAPIVGTTVTRVDVHHPDVVSRESGAFAKTLAGRRFTGVDRRGKYLLLSLDDGSTLVGHLRMSGRLTLDDPAAAVPPHTHLVLALSSGFELRYQDVRRFGRFLIVEAGEALPGGLGRLGPEPFDPTLTPKRFFAMLAARRGSVKGVLLDQAFVAGLGNIYVDEALFLAGIHPLTPTPSIGQADAGRLLAAMRDVLGQGIAHRGTTFGSYLDVNGKPGENERWLRVFRREGKSCPRCGSAIVKIRVAGRGTHLCPTCQPLRQRRRRTRTTSFSNTHPSRKHAPTSNASGGKKKSPARSS